MNRSRCHPYTAETTTSGVIAVMAFVTAAMASFVTPTAYADDDAPDFNRDVKPILTRHCFACHGPDISTRQSGLRVDEQAAVLEHLTRDGRAALSPGHPDDSEIWLRVSSDDPNFQMPPDAYRSVSAEELDILRRWIESGAAYDTHWSWRPIEQPAIPEVDDATWAQDPLDHFILASLDDADLRPAVEADRRTLLRRLSVDLTGLPPTPERVEAFLHDGAPDAYDRLVDELLASPQFGEHWARHWLDLMRYAETYGHEFDYPIHDAWQYRDYVIRAFNADVPYDDFIREHLAGDLTPPRRHPTDGFDESRIATGFWYLSQATHGPVDVRADEAERVDNQIDVMSKAFLGVTVSCARCHDHKFDPISTKDYYALAGFLQSSRRERAYLDPGAHIAAAYERLAATHETVRADVRTGMSRRDASLTPVTTYVHATFDVLDGPPRPDDPPVTPSFISFEGFEDGTYDGWTVEGTAFGDSPQTRQTIGSWQGEVDADGTFFVNSHQTRAEDNASAADSHEGRLVSRSFTIDRPFMHFLIGGGNHAGRTCMNLVIDGKAVRTATGPNNNRMVARRFDLREFVGQSAHLEIVDAARGGWGHIAVDRIVFADTEDLRPALARPVATVAAERKLDLAHLTAWCDAVQRARARTDDPGHRLVTAASGPDRHESPVFESFNGDREADAWFRSGWAFGQTSTTSDIRLTRDGVRLAPTGCAHSGLHGGPLQGTLRSPTFELDSDWIEYDAAGQGQIRLIIDGYHLDEFNALLFEGLLARVNTGSPDRMSVVRHDVHRYRGHRAYIELIDDGDGQLVVDEIRFGRHGDERRSAASPVDQSGAERVSEQIMAAHEAWRAGTAAADQTAIINWLLDRSLLELDVHERADDAVARATEVLNSVPRPMRVVAMTAGTPEDEYVFVRGDHRQRGDMVPRRFIESLNPEAPQASDRLQLAEQILADSNPLTARVMVNRVWQHLFGTGIVPTPDDFGGLGRAPEHPELLDLLASWYRAEGDWSTKALIRRIVRSSTYRMAGRPSDPRAMEVDPTNELLHHRTVRRLSAEALRDTILAVSGRLDDRSFGPPVPIHLTNFMTGRGRPGHNGPLDGDGRRSIYIEVRRNFLAPMMTAFDAPLPFTTVGRRHDSNVPAQALILLNDPFVHEQSRMWAARLTETVSDPADRVQRAYLEALARAATATEIDAALGFIETQTTLHDGDAAAAWADLCHVIFNLKEFIYVD